MIRTSLAQAATWMKASLEGVDGEFRGVSTDSRQAGPGALFFALRGPTFDGHAYVTAAAARGCVAAVTERAAQTDVPELRVADTRIALGRLAAAWRRRMQAQVVAVTGSNGKTTVKEMIAGILSGRGPLTVTRGNLNNDIGLPLTLLEMRAEDLYAVVELGASAAGEIAYLTRLARPDVALVNNAGPAHLEGFGSIRGVATAKGEIFQGLGSGGVAVFNADDTHAGLWSRQCAGLSTLSFGFSEQASLRGVLDGDRLTICLQGERASCPLPLPGRHNAMNALAAAAACTALGVPLSEVVDGLQRVRPVGGRLNRVPGPCGAQLIDDTYNANPASLAAGLEVLCSGAGEHWLVLGDMAELGAAARELHAEAGRLSRQTGVHRLYALGEQAAAAAEAFGAGGQRFASVAELHAELKRALAARQQGPLTILVKGSRSMRMERLLDALRGGGES
jgi:UDP-N-acetylmuramoyl-tripeptide--D-alanyl-D-alanine ligase